MKYKIQKKDLAGKVTYEYEGRLLKSDSNSITIEAFFDREDMPFQDVVLKKGDRFIETYYFDRWYNIFEIYDRDDSKVKGWYCNVCEPAVVDGPLVSYIDLFLDLWVSANGDQFVLDEQEFFEYVIDEKIKSSALRSLTDLRQRFFKKLSVR